MIAVSFAPAHKNKAFVEHENLPYEMWTDTNRTLGMTYGAASSSKAKLAKRVTVVLDPEGNQLLTYGGIVNVFGHPAAVLEDCQRVFKGAKRDDADQ